MGLMNLGNSCFMNAVLQAFLSVSDSISIVKYNTTDTNSITYAFADLAHQVHTQSRPVHPVRFRSAFVNKFAFFDSTEQQDAFEFTTLLLDALHEETSSASTPASTPTSVHAAFDLASLTAAQLSSLARSGQSQSPVATDFQGQLLVRTSGNCGCMSGKFEPFFGLSVPVVTSEGALIGNFQEAISEFQRPQRLTDADQWHCGTCNERVDAETRSEIYRTPDILIVNFKRFRFTREGRVEKLTQLVDYPLDTEIGESHFRLFAVVLHSGSASSGHYPAIARNSAGGWKSFNDQHVREHSYSGPSADAYILFYKRMTPSPIRP